MGINGTSTLALNADGQIVAAATPPAGVTSNFNNPDWTGDNVVKANIVALSTSAIFLGLRLYTRVYLVRQPGLDDVFVLLAWLFSLALGITTCIEATRYGLGSHIWDVKLSLYSPHFLKLDIVSQIFYFLANMFIKCSILYFLLRASARLSGPIRWYLWSLLTFSVLYNIACIFKIIFSCNPVPALWDVTLMAGAHCVNPHQTFVAVACINVVTDILVLISPLLLFIGIEMPVRQKIAVIGLLTIGGLACVFSIIRLVTIARHDHLGDNTRSLVATVCWSILEVGSGCVCACAACLKPFFRHHFKWFPSTSSSKMAPSSYVLGSLSTQNCETLRLRPDDGPNGVNTSTVTTNKHNFQRPKPARIYPRHLLPQGAPTDSSQEDLIVPAEARRERIVVTVTSDFGVVEDRVASPVAPAVEDTKGRKRWW
ncbi:hypothetical protein BZA05DRAFT_440142 [Tricharina praecox]|uniref:uncharacterized protein n=1 Tax=Tricharina praecox TaxID=43433 RepID=UPI0022211D3E|nr:uncharacterized protein BZA05DRAFT_440142 [Tricharina praecox]KAI5858487.1 hypothetical protein BZA05DRAFT_440142 [Tricharina praecox]